MGSAVFRKKVACFAVASQIILVALGAAQLDPWHKLGGVGKVLEYYSTLSGAGSGYGFFAPGVGSQLRASFEVQLKDQIAVEYLHSGFNHEADLRIGNILDWFSNPESDRKLQRALAASWAGKMFGRHPDADKVTVKIDTYLLPSMREFAAGRRPRWKPYYSASFQKRSSKKQDADGET